MSEDKIDPLTTMPADLSELPSAIKARDQKIILWMDASIRLSQDRFNALDIKTSALSVGLFDNTAATKRIEEKLTQLTEKTQDLVKMAEAAKGANTILNLLGALAKPLASILFLVMLAGVAWVKFRDWWGK